MFLLASIKESKLLVDGSVGADSPPPPLMAMASLSSEDTPPSSGGDELACILGTSVVVSMGPISPPSLAGGIESSASSLPSEWVPSGSKADELFCCFFFSSFARDLSLRFSIRATSDDFSAKERKSIMFIRSFSNASLTKRLASELVHECLNFLSRVEEVNF